VTVTGRFVRCRFAYAAGAIALLAAAGCELAETTAPAVEPRVVVHAVLNPASAQQMVIVEQTLQSVVGGTGGSPTYQPITNARVVIYGPRGDSVIVPAATGAGATAGTYHAPSVTITDGSPGTRPPNVLRVRPGERYRLRVETTFGVVTGETVIPDGWPVDAGRRTFNLDRDTLRIDASRVRSAAGYLLRHESRVFAAERFVTDLGATLVRPLASASDDQEWAFSFAHPLILPGRPQTFIIVAVDSNYFRYSEGGFDPFGDETRGNSLSGGVGVFGAVTMIMAKTLDLTADIDTPFEGAWTADRVSATLPLAMILYASPGFPRDQPFDFRISLSGTAQMGGGRQLEVTATATGDTRFFRFLDPNTPFLTEADGVLSAGTLVLTDRRSGERVTYRKS
jgi:hypothetical protein